jgi:hypothetical protein
MCLPSSRKPGARVHTSLRVETPPSLKPLEELLSSSSRDPASLIGHRLVILLVSMKDDYHHSSLDEEISPVPMHRVCQRRSRTQVLPPVLNLTYLFLVEDFFARIFLVKLFPFQMFCSILQTFCLGLSFYLKFLYGSFTFFFLTTNRNILNCHSNQITDRSSKEDRNTQKSRKQRAARCWSPWRRCRRSRRRGERRGIKDACTQADTAQSVG